MLLLGSKHRRTCGWKQSPRLSAFRNPRSPIAAFAMGGAVLVSLVTLLPLGFIIWITIQTGWTTAFALVFRPRVGELIVNTMLLELGAIPAAIVLAVVLAWLVERTDLPGARLWSGLAVAPLAIPAFIHSYAWMSLTPGWRGLPAAIVISVLAYFPFFNVAIVDPPSRSCFGGSRGSARAWPLAGLFPGGATAVETGDLWRCVADRPALVGGIRSLRHGPVRYSDDRNHGPVSVGV